jgi:hypothetical protein
LPVPTTPRPLPRRPPFAPPQPPPRAAIRGAPHWRALPFCPLLSLTPRLWFSSRRADVDRHTSVHRAPPPPAILYPIVTSSSSSTACRCTSTTLPAPAPTNPPDPHCRSSPLDAHCRGQPALASLRPSQPHPEHSAAEFDLPVPQGAHHHHRTPPPTAVPLRSTTPHHRARSSGEDLPVPTPQMGAPRCRAALAPLLHRPRCRQARAGRTVASAAIGRAPSPVSAEMGHPEIGRPVLARLHSATYNFSIWLKID